jgi:copper chaperone CopZ
MVTAFEVKNIHCQACVKRITVAIEKALPGARVTIDLATGLVSVATNGRQTTSTAEQAAIIAAVETAGYQARVAA